MYVCVCACMNIKDFFLKLHLVFIFFTKGAIGQKSRRTILS